MDDLRKVLEDIQREDKKLRRKAAGQRRFIVVEGLYRNYGDICPLDELVVLKNEFFYRLIVDESLSFGTLGPRGLGLQVRHTHPHPTRKHTSLTHQHSTLLIQIKSPPRPPNFAGPF